MAKKRAGKNVTFKDRRTGLVIFGIIHFLIGTLCALGIPLTIFSMMAASVLDKSAAPPMGVGQMMLVVILYLLLAAWFVWMGIGSILARKWARALIVITSWLWLICGLIVVIFILVFIPAMFSQLAAGEEMPREGVVIAAAMLTAFLVFVFLIIPGAFVLFYSSRHVKATCEQRDPRRRWTDKTPLPVITLSSLLGCMAISMLWMGIYRWTTHFFGLVVSGVPGAAIILIYTVLFAYAAWGTYKLQVASWWCGFLSTLALGVSMVITFSRVSLLEFYEKMGMPQERLEILQRLDMFHDPRMVIFWGLMIIGFLGFMLYTKRYFKASAL